MSITTPDSSKARVAATWPFPAAIWVAIVSVWANKCWVPLQLKVRITASWPFMAADSMIVCTASSLHGLRFTLATTSTSMTASCPLLAAKSNRTSLYCLTGYRPRLSRYYSTSVCPAAAAAFTAFPSEISYSACRMR